MQTKINSDFLDQRLVLRDELLPYYTKDETDTLVHDNTILPINYISETQIGWYEVSTGAFKRKYHRRFSFTDIALSTSGTNSTLGTFTFDFKLLSGTGHYVSDMSPTVQNILPVNRYNNPSLTDYVVISIVGSGRNILLANQLGVGSESTAKITGEVDITYLKTAETTYTLDQITAM
jgi:hypothetical protein